MEEDGEEGEAVAEVRARVLERRAGSEGKGTKGTLREEEARSEEG